MKKNEHNATHDDDCLTYFPHYNEGKCVFILLTIGLLIFVIVNICILCFDASSNSTTPALLAIFSAVALSFAILTVVYRNMADEFVLTRDAILHRNVRKNIQVKILWECVSKVSFHQDKWNGRKICKVYFKTTSNSTPNKKCDYIIPVNSVNQTELLSFIPPSLFADDPNHKWFS